MATKRRFKVRVRGKVRNRLLRRGGIAAGTALGLLLAAWGGAAVLKHSSGLLSGRFLAFKPKSVALNCPSAAAYPSLMELVSGAASGTLTGAQARELSGRIRRLHPGMAEVRIFRNFFTGKVSVTAVPELVVAPVLSDGATAYLGITGRLLPEDLSEAPTPHFPVELRHAPEKAPELAAFLSSFAPLSGLLYSSPAGLSCDGSAWDCTLRLQDGSEVLWGGFEFTKLKILRLNEVMKVALSKSRGPLRADLRNFREGKIFVSAVNSGKKS